MKTATEKVRRIRRDTGIAAMRNKEARSQEAISIQDQYDPQGRYHTRLLGQVNAEYDLCWRFMRPKIQEWFLRLSLYNNQIRDKDRVGDPLLFAVMQTVLANLYSDTLSVEMGGRVDRDEKNAENLELVYDADAADMQKAQLDLEWDWDALFFGRGLKYMNEFDYGTMTPVAEIWDPLTFIRDPRAQSINGDRNRQNALRFGGREIRKTLYEMKQNPEYFNLDFLKKSGETSPLSLTWEARQARRSAQGYDSIGNWENSVTENYEFTLMQWLTHIGGRKYIVELANDRTLVVRVTPIHPSNVSQADNIWPIIDRPFNPMSHDWDGVSIPDIIEDKQRFRSVLINVAGDAAKLATYPQWLFDENRIRKSVDKSPNFAKWIPVNGDPSKVAIPMPHSQGVDQTVGFIMNFLQDVSQKAFATNENTQGTTQKGSGGKKLATDINKAAQGTDTRYSLAQKIWGWSEAEEVRQWYRCLKKYMPGGLEKKYIRLEGALGIAIHREYTRNDLMLEHDLGPVIKIESRQVSEARKMRLYSQMSDFVKNFVLEDPNADTLYARRKLGNLVMPVDEVERMIPMTVDEEIALEENKKLSDDQTVNVSKDDNHTIHLRVHGQLDQNDATVFHVKAHQLALVLKRMEQEKAAMAQGGAEGGGAPGGGQPQPGAGGPPGGPQKPAMPQSGMVAPPGTMAPSEGSPTMKKGKGAAPKLAGPAPEGPAGQAPRV